MLRISPSLENRRIEKIGVTLCREISKDAPLKFYARWDDGITELEFCGISMGFLWVAGCDRSRSIHLHGRVLRDGGDFAAWKV